ncbi:hypothetical protein F5887DRAFT_957912 [Amanita rubescens]|nr:hypothetical protein F5887DRAFT_957912 [Amanita rubescens]
MWAAKLLLLRADNDCQLSPSPPMARTKNTGRKCTGEDAPRKQIASISGSTRAATPKKRLGRAGSSKAKAPTATPPIPQNLNLSAIELGAEPSTAAIFCALCRNGGALTDCDTCPRTVCSKCVPNVQLSVNNQFSCPHCHIFRSNGARNNLKPYLDDAGVPLTVTGMHSQREFMPVCSSEPLLMITIKLVSIPCDGLPPMVVYQHLYPYLRQNIQHIIISFDFSTPDSVDNYVREVSTLAQRIRSGNLVRFQRFAVFLIDHTDPSRGDLHFAPENQGAAPVSEIFPMLFPPPLLEVLKPGSDQNTITLLACGGTMKHTQSFNEVKTFLNTSPFHSLMAFGQVDFQPSTANAFLMDTNLFWFIYRRNPVSGMLLNHQVLGSHSDVYVLYHSGSAERLTWSHPGHRPFGFPLPIQCTGCKALKSFIPKPQVNQEKTDFSLIRLVCNTKDCTNVLEYPKPPGLHRVMKGELLRSPVGEWYREVVGF